MPSNDAKSFTLISCSARSRSIAILTGCANAIHTAALAMSTVDTHGSADGMEIGKLNPSASRPATILPCNSSGTWNVTLFWPALWNCGNGSTMFSAWAKLEASWVSLAGFLKLVGRLQTPSHKKPELRRHRMSANSATRVWA